MDLDELFPVTVFRDDEVLFQTNAQLMNRRGEPFETYQIYNTGLDHMRTAIKEGHIRDDAFDVANKVVIERPLGVLTCYSSAQITALFDEVENLEKVRATRDMRIVLSKKGGVIGGALSGPRDVELACLTEDDFTSVQEICDQLQSRKTKFEYGRSGGDASYVVKLGRTDQAEDEMKTIYDKGPFSPVPLVVFELQKILKRYDVQPKRELQANMDLFLKLQGLEK